MEALVQRHLGTSGTDVDLRTQLVLYEVGWVTWAQLAGKKEVQFASGSHLGLPPLECPAVGGWRHR